MIISPTQAPIDEKQRKTKEREHAHCSLLAQLLQFISTIIAVY
jgi:hypothetical protein